VHVQANLVGARARSLRTSHVLPHADPQWIRACTQAAGIDQVSLRMPMSYEFLVGDMGSTLSCVQKQRIFIARARYRRPALLLLDEPTNDLDERSIDLKLAQLRQRPMTRVIITHNSQVTSIADRPFLMVLPRVQ
jgi:ATP-binding cassette, subfamily B, bacterial CvaB/MchF/RaxB